MAKKSSALSSLGTFFSGGASGVARKLGAAAGGGISALAGGATRATGRAGTALGGAIAGMGTTGGRTSLPTIRQGPSIRPYTPTAPGQGRYDNPPMRPTSGARSGYGIGPSGSGGVATGSYQDAFAAKQSRWYMQRKEYEQKEANKRNIEAYNKALKEANKANEARYQQLLGIADATTGQRAKDITADFTGQQASAMQNLANLGLANTSGASTIRGGFGRKKNEALDRLADQMQQTKLGIIERRQDLPPSLASLVSLGQLGVSGVNFG